jgi:hypothetical protein
VNTISTYKWIVKRKDEVQWYTKDIINNKHVFIMTNVTYVANAHLNIKGRPQLASIAVVVNIPYNKNIVYSGSVMTVDSKPYVVSYISNNMDETITSVIAIAVMPHEYLIQVRNEA